MKLSNRQREYLKSAYSQEQCYVSPVISAARRTVVGLVKRGLIEWVHDDDQFEHRITDAGKAAYNATIPVPEVIPFEFDRMGEAELRKFVLDFCANKLICDFQVPPSVWGTVFFPLALGALSLPDELQPEESTAEEPEPPPVPEKPEPPPKPKLGTAPKILPRLTKLKDEIRAFRNQLEWGDVDDADLEGFMVSIADDKTQLEAEWEEVQAVYRRQDEAHEGNLTLWRAEKAAQAREHKAALRLYDQERKVYAKAQGAYDAEIEAHNEIRSRTTELYFAKLGLVYGYYSDGVGTRAIDGFPMLAKCSLMHQLDWDRARIAIDRELQRQKDIEI